MAALPETVAFKSSVSQDELKKFPIVKQMVDSPLFGLNEKAGRYGGVEE